MSKKQSIDSQKNVKPIDLESFKDISYNSVEVDGHTLADLKKESTEQIFRDEKVLETLKRLARV
ncbi:hypothetical protein [Furfurilactobacillus entadae]|uniref:hypothetical protein n=1 Tax=Furfurilactobacillus entadae TaxID=2922307 RepID=UPI0035EED4BB